MTSNGSSLTFSAKTFGDSPSVSAFGSAISREFIEELGHSAAVGCGFRQASTKFVASRFGCCFDSVFLLVVMDIEHSSEPLIFDLDKISVDHVNATLAACPSPDVDVTFVSKRPKDMIAIGMAKSIRLQVHGDLGDFCLVCTSDVDIEVHGTMGCGAGEAIRSGTIVVRGNAGDAFGAFGIGGLVATYGSVGSRCAAGLAGADVIVRGSVGPQAAYQMRDGTLIIGGTAGRDLGAGMSGGTIFLRGEAESIASSIEKIRMRESEKMRLGLLMLKAGIIAKSADFSVYRAVGAT